MCFGKFSVFKPKNLQHTYEYIGGIPFDSIKPIISWLAKGQQPGDPKGSIRWLIATSPLQELANKLLVSKIEKKN